MAGLSDYLERKVLDHTLGTAAFTMPTGVYAALFTADPTDANNTANEVSTTSTGYARKAVTFSASTTNGSGVTSTSNSADVLFDVATASWGTITNVGLYDAATAGNLLWSGALSTQKLISSSDQFKLPTGNITVQLD